MEQVNWLAVIAAAISAFVIGGLWYGPLFKHAWCREAGIDLNSAPKHPTQVFAIGFVCSLIAAAVFATFLGKSTMLHGLTYGVATGLGWVAMSFGINYAFAQRSLKLWLIDGGYHTVQFALYGLILGLWH